MRRTIWAYSAVGTASLPAVWSVPAEAQVYDWSGPFAGAALGVIFPNGTAPLNYPEGTTAPNTVFFNGGVPLFSGEVRAHGVTVSGGIDQIYSARSRIGVALDRLLLFGTGGLALGHADLRTTAYLDQGKGSADWQGVVSAWRLGFIAGAEYAVTDHLSLKLEGLYYNLGTAKAATAGTGDYWGTPLNVAPYGTTIDLSGTIIRGGFNLRF